LEDRIGGKLRLQATRLHQGWNPRRAHRLRDAARSTQRRGDGADGTVTQVLAKAS